MKTIIKILIRVSVTILFSTFLIGIVSGQTPPKEKTSKINFQETKHDFGKVVQGVELVYEYKFKNDGEDTLVIKNVRASCGCTGASIGDKKKFENGEEGEIKVTFNTTGRSGMQSKTVSVQSNDPENPNAVLSFTCEIITNNK